MPDHERCAECESEAHQPIVYVYCKNRNCGWRAPSWEQWDRVMRAAREAKERSTKICNQEKWNAQHLCDMERMIDEEGPK
jgi:hypothetical protein